MSRATKRHRNIWQVTPTFRRPWNYLASYLTGLPMYLLLILLNCRFVIGKFFFNWDGTSWYFTLCFLSLPLEKILVAKTMGRPSRTATSTQRHPIHYTTLHLPLHQEIDHYASIQIVLAAGGIIFAPLLIGILFVHQRSVT